VLVPPSINFRCRGKDWILPACSSSRQPRNMFSRPLAQAAQRPAVAEGDGCEFDISCAGGRAYQTYVLRISVHTR